MGAFRALLLTQLTEFLAESGMTASALGRDAVGDNKLVQRIRAGEGITLKTIERLESFMAARRLAVRAQAKERVAA